MLLISVPNIPIRRYAQVKSSEVNGAVESAKQQIYEYVLPYSQKICTGITLTFNAICHPV